MTIAEYLEQRGREKGKHEARLAMAKKMLKNGLDRALVMKITGLSEQQLKQL